MKVRELLSRYRWPLYLTGLLVLPIVANGILVWVATRPDVPRPIRGFYEASQRWDADEAVLAASRQLGWSVRFDLPAGVPVTPGMPRPVDVIVTDKAGQGVAGLAGSLLAQRPADSRAPLQGSLVALPQQPGAYRTLVRLDPPGAWELRLEATLGAARFVHGARVTVPAAAGGSK